ncbi:MAG: hypothetical protein ACP6IP_00655 [Candidatus Njordarchaeia archaeon]
MARIRQRMIKDAAKRIIVNYWDIVKEIWDRSTMIEDLNPELAAQYRVEMYKNLVERVTNIKSKKIRNRVAGYLISFMKQILHLGRVSLEELATRYTLKREPAIAKSEEEMESESPSTSK